MKTRTVIYAEDGMILTNGETYGTQIFLADGEDTGAYHEITREEYDKILEAESADTETL